jgi:NAD(P)-dependent dehydrogenase (short-subunit alcohol dehydrogenase family)
MYLYETQRVRRTLALMGSLFDLRGRTALVTGGSRGLGEEIAAGLAESGASLMLIARRAQWLDPTVEAFRARGFRCQGLAADTADPESAATAVRRTVEAFGRIDILINNAGLIASGTVEDVTEETLQRLFAVHVAGTTGAIRAAFGHMRRHRHGRIVNVVSEAALFRQPSAGIAYAAAKAAVWGVNMSVANDGAGHGVTANAVSPGALTRMSEGFLTRTGIPAGLDLSPDRVADVVVALCADDAGDITGRVVHTAGGFVREYVLRRTDDTDLVRRLRKATAQVSDSPG